MQCECCGRQRIQRKSGESVFVCRCTEALLCRGCNHCEAHCQCIGAAPDLDVPLMEQLAVAKLEWRRVGVRV